MNSVFKWAFMVCLDGILAGFFGLAMSMLNFFWLELARKEFPQVNPSERYQLAVIIVCGSAFFVLTFLRQIQTQLDTKMISGKELMAIVILAMIALIGLTPVPGTNFPSHLYDIYGPVKSTKVENTNSPALSTNKDEPSLERLLHR